MTTAVTTVLASCQRILLGRPSFAPASPAAPAVASHWGFDPCSQGAGLAVPALRVSRHAHGALDASPQAPQWG